MKIVSIVGARPQFIKGAALSRILRKEFQEVLIHTGQHYDKNMSDVFFDELHIPKPEYNLGISGGTHGKMTGRMMEAIEDVLLNERPDMVLVYGDTNSTLAGALAAVKLHIPVCHVEAGIRMNTLKNPEEVNRICTDHVSSLLCCCTESGVDSLKAEGIKKNVFLTGDLMYDAFCYYKNRITGYKYGELTDLEGNIVEWPKEYYYLTCHREENTAKDDTLKEILDAMNELDAVTVYPVHPRNRKRARQICQERKYEKIILVNPVGYLTSIALVCGAKKIVTDSGGLQREAFFAGVQCVTVFDTVIWKETMINNYNQLTVPKKEEIVNKLQNPIEKLENYYPFGDGHAAEAITQLIKHYIYNL